jgi:hypothetical protein
MSSGSAQRAKIIDLDGLASLIEKLSSREALALGALRPACPITFGSSRNIGSRVSQSRTSLLERPTTLLT